MTACGSSSSAPANPPPPPAAPANGDPDVDAHTREYVKQIRGCEAAVSLVRAGITEASDLIEVADLATKARDICDNTRSNLVTINTDHFDDQASEGFYAVDRSKSGLNALLAYVDSQAPSKLIEARDKLNDGEQAAKEAIRGINARRRVYGLPPIR
ncbi:MAG TPA: hypothetical protein VE596_09820 [Gaiellaceae bacterium]|jgi:hypothetical protein|nr:hypothetical protein [Gaiellaceae bacterium]